MPNEFYDVDGNLVEGVVSPEDAAKVQAELEEAKVQLAKLENKDLNFRRLESLTEAEKAKLSATELELKKKAEELEDKQKTFTEKFVGDIKGDELRRLTGSDEELKKKVEFNFARLKEADTAQSREEISKLMNEAYVMSVGRQPSSPLNAAINQSGSGPIQTSNSTLAEELSGVAKGLGVSEEDYKKYNK